MRIFEKMKHYHYIFAGAGLSSLMVVLRLAGSGHLSNKNVLLLDSDAKNSNDRTWCFWENGTGPWDAITHRVWNTAIFADSTKSTDLDFGPYKYKMVRGADFYRYAFTALDDYPNVQFEQQKVTDFADLGAHVLVKTETENYTCNKLFSSIYNPALLLGQKKYPVLQQHFIGWHVKADNPVFDPDKPVFMDFSIPQKRNTRFMYVLPFSSNEAIVEYTLFSKDLLPKAEYEAAIRDYLEQLGAGNYIIEDKERGSIPMTVYPFWRHNTQNIMYIGSAGGWTKASTGYTFRNADRLSVKLAAFLQEHENLKQFYKPGRYRFYDMLLLDLLARHNHKGSIIFSSLFHKGKAASVLKFLDEETSLREDLSVILKCPKGPFLNALLRRIFNL